LNHDRESGSFRKRIGPKYTRTIRKSVTKKGEAFTPKKQRITPPREAENYREGSI